jgi:hypothetical protein
MTFTPPRRGLLAPDWVDWDEDEEPRLFFCAENADVKIYFFKKWH